MLPILEASFAVWNLATEPVNGATGKAVDINQLPISLNIDQSLFSKVC